MRPILATIHQSALAHNLQIVRQCAPHSKVMSVVKANGYGHGLLNAAHGLSATEGFAVLGLNEAVDLREAGFDQTILMLEGVFNANELVVASSFNVDIVVHCIPQIEMLENITLARQIDVHLKMNTGMNRLGFTPEVFLNAFERLTACKNIGQITSMTHFATADDETGIDKPLALFKRTVKDLKQPTSLANSAAILRHPVAHTDWVRPGIMLYGASPVSGVAASTYNLKPAMSLTTKVISVQKVQKGESVGYGNHFTATKTTKVGIIACGYADGYPRHAGQYADNQSTFGALISVCGKLAQTLGRVSMDMLFCDLTNIPEANIGAPVELWGKQVPVDTVAQACGTVGYELLCAVASRVAIQVSD